MDVLSDAIAAVRLGRPHASRTLVAAPWGFRFLPASSAGFHVVLHGSCWVLPPGDAPPVHVHAGDVVFLPTGRGHGLADSPGTPLVDVPPTALVEFGAPAPPGSPLADTSPAAAEGAGPALLLCGAYQLDRGYAHPLLLGMPDVIHLPARIGHHPALRAAVDLLGTELESRRPGSDAVVTALLDALLLYIVRAWLEAAPAQDAPAGWAAALTDPVVHTALRHMHQRPGDPWTVESLAAAVGLSRAAFARRFSTLTGRPPLAYLTWWRMVLAGRLLRSSDASLGAVAYQVGYTSEFAFAKAFKRHFGVAPGRYRRHPTLTAAG
ncbi:AraC family transcriptional regulator [Pseudonocardia adelaidensis]|uniref:AraC family transcriptional regulator n=1 Tax=Pseudonocardia adelaidensis TaxID=648754 RepID=A0ABP9NV67_9PSEU